MTIPQELRELHSELMDYDRHCSDFDIDKAAAFLLEYADLLQKQLDSEQKAATMSEEYTRSISKRMTEIRCQ